MYSHVTLEFITLLARQPVTFTEKLRKRLAGVSDLLLLTGTNHNWQMYSNVAYANDFDQLLAISDVKAKLTSPGRIKPVHHSRSLTSANRFLRLKVNYTR